MALWSVAQLPDLLAEDGTVSAERASRRRSAPPRSRCPAAITRAARFSTAPK
jgi:hypothetical protein